MALTNEVARRRDIEDGVRLHVTLITTKDHNAKRENVPKLRLMPEVLTKMIKNYIFY